MNPGPGQDSLSAVAGLSADDAARRLQQFGPNKLPEPRPVPGWRRLLAELTHFFAKESVIR